MVVAYPPLEAYRRDVARLGEGRAFGPHDGRWVAAAVLLQRYTETVLAERQAVGARLASYLALESELTFASAALQLGREIEEAGALHLATSWLALLERSIPDDRALDLGRIRTARARVARRLGDADAARTLYADVEALGEQHAEPELTARAWIGFGVMAAERGNYPEARRWYEAAVLVAEDTGCVEQAALAHQGLMVVYATGGDIERGIIEGWHAYRASADDKERASELLSNVAQMLYQSGRYASALHGFAAVVGRAEQPRTMLGALGGVAMAAGALGQSGVVDAAAKRIERIVGAAWSHPVALALLDLSDAYHFLGDANAAARFRADALRLAEANAHFELVHRAGSAPPHRPATSAPPTTFGTAAARIVDHVDSLAAPLDLCVAG